MRTYEPQSGKNYPMPGVTQSNLGMGRIVISIILFALLFIGGGLWFAKGMMEQEGLDFSMEIDQLVGSEEFIPVLFAVIVPILFTVFIVVSIMNAVKRLQANRDLIRGHFEQSNPSMSTENPISKTNKPIESQTPEETFKQIFTQIQTVFNKNKNVGNDGSKKKSGIAGWIFLIYIIGSIIMSIVGSILESL